MLRHRLLRVNNVLGKVFVPFILALLYFGYNLAVFQIGHGYLVLALRRAWLGSAYIAVFNVLFFWLLYCFALVYFHTRHHSRPPRDPPARDVNKACVYLCDQDGAPARCQLDECNGSWLSTRTRHCRDCGTCKVGFDHHCPFLDACITTQTTLKPFVCLIATAVPLIGIGALPVLKPTWDALQAVRKYTWHTDYMYEAWWNKWYSWVGGPLWRWSAAIVIGIRHYQSLEPIPPPLVPLVRATLTGSDGLQYEFEYSSCPLLADPHLSTIIIVTSAIFVMLIGIAMLFSIYSHARDGTSSMQIERVRIWKNDSLATTDKPQLKSERGRYDPSFRLFVPVPDHPSGRKGAVVLVPPDTPLYDHGPRTNLRNMFGRSWREWLDPRHMPLHDDFDLNETVLQELTKEARSMLDDTKP